MSPNLLHYKNAAFPCVAVETVEEERFLLNLRAIPDVPILLINALGGLRDARDGSVIDGSAQFPKAVNYLRQQSGALLVMFDYQTIIKNPGGYRILKDAFSDLKTRGSMIILVAPSWSLPAELSHDITVLQFDLPTRLQLRRALETVAKGADITVPEGDIEGILDSAAGLTIQEAENSMALALVEKKRLDAATVEREKMRLVKSSGFLEVSASVNPASVGGLGELKAYIKDEVIPSKGDALLRVRGILTVGVPGTGKSLVSRALGAMLGWPVLKMDVGSLKGSLVGQSESNMKAALRLADAVAPCVLWLDEIEKGVGGHASSAQSDGGTTLGMLGQLLCWLQDHETPCITIATCNDYSKLPSELTRAGRFDERFFVDLPTPLEREEIARVHLLKYAGEADGLCPKIAAVTADWTGAEIEQLIKSAARRTNRKVTLESINTAAKSIKPIAKVKADEISRLRDWAKDTLRIANTPQVVTEGGRKVVVNG